MAFVTTACMVSSEIIAKTRKRTLTRNRSRNMVIPNLIPFTTLNLIFAFSIVFSTIVRVIQKTKIGVPNLSTQIVVMLICLLMSNTEAKAQFKQRVASIRKEALPIQQRSTTNQDTRNNVINFHTKSRSPTNDQIISNQKTRNKTEENTKKEKKKKSITRHK
jgi:glucan phosphoethanolaminetransferase (alkaline phosphatase superfamily)